jgi:hypothetical protein
MLCLALWCSGDGGLLVMATAQPLAKEADHAYLFNRGDFPDWDYRPGEDDEPFEYKASD